MQLTNRYYQQESKNIFLLFLIGAAIALAISAEFNQARKSFLFSANGRQLEMPSEGKSFSASTFHRREGLSPFFCNHQRVPG